MARQASWACISCTEITPSWFMLFMLWRVVHTDFALVVQDDGWVLDGKLWRDEYLNYDYIGAPTHLAHVLTPEGDYWSRGFAWAENLAVNSRAVPVLMRVNPRPTAIHILAEIPVADRGDIPDMRYRVRAKRVAA